MTAPKAMSAKEWTVVTHGIYAGFWTCEIVDVYAAYRVRAALEETAKLAKSNCKCSILMCGWCKMAERVRAMMPEVKT